MSQLLRLHRKAWTRSGGAKTSKGERRNSSRIRKFADSYSELHKKYGKRKKR